VTSARVATSIAGWVTWFMADDSWVASSMPGYKLAKHLKSLISKHCAIDRLH
jgi:hypothetical protein